MRPSFRFILLGVTLSPIIAEFVQAQSPPAAHVALQEQIAAGQKLFDVTCASQYCHGTGGAGGQGPRLIGASLTAQQVLGTLSAGRPGTPMPAFNDVLDAAQLRQVAAYVLSISSGATLPTAALTDQIGAPVAGTASGVVAPATPSSLPIPVGTEQGIPSAGASIFFDATKLSSCRTCHSYGKRGGPLGPDLAETHETPGQILASLSGPRLASPAYPVIVIKTVQGTIEGIRGTETSDELSVYEVVTPPVRYSLLKTQIRAIKVSDRGAYDHTQLGLSHQQLLDVTAFLASSSPLSDAPPTLPARQPDKP